MRSAPTARQDDSPRYPPFIHSPTAFIHPVSAAP
jgi:hypothetical protein